MALKEKIAEEMRSAMKRTDKLRLETLRSIRASLLEKEIAKRGKGTMTEDDELNVLQSGLKKRKESIELFEKGGRKDLVEKETQELEIIQSFLPKQMDMPKLKTW